MALQVILHLHNEDPFLAEVDALPAPGDNFIKVSNPRKRDGKALATLAHGVTTVIYPWTRVTFVEVLDGEGGGETQDSLMGFFREDGRAR
jgi:hypothetical protein